MGGCVVSTVIGALWCRKGCNASELAGEFAYFPPTPPSYFVTRGADGALAITLNQRYFGARHVASLTRTRADVVELVSRGGVRIPALHFRARGGARLTVLFSHSNAVDLGLLYRFLGELSDRLQVDVFAYELTGYGPTVGVAAPRNHTQVADVEAAADYLEQRCGLNLATQVIAYGQSIGSYPTLHLASRRRLFGVVLHSPIAAGLAVIARVQGACAPQRVFSCIEPYPNTRLARRLRDPLLVIHGTLDETVHVRHGEALQAACPSECRHAPYWVGGATHDDVVEVDEAAFYARLRAFMLHCARRKGADGTLQASTHSARSSDWLVGATARDDDDDDDAGAARAADGGAAGNADAGRSEWGVYAKPVDATGSAPAGREPVALPPIALQPPQPTDRFSRGTDTLRSVHPDELALRPDEELRAIALHLEGERSSAAAEGADEPRAHDASAPAEIAAVAAWEGGAQLSSRRSSAGGPEGLPRGAVPGVNGE